MNKLAEKKNELSSLSERLNKRVKDYTLLKLSSEYQKQRRSGIFLQYSSEASNAGQLHEEDALLMID